MSTSDYRAPSALNRHLPADKQNTPVRDSSASVVVRAVLDDGRTGGFSSVASAAKYFAVTDRILRRWIDRQEVGVGGNGRRCSKIWMCGGKQVARNQRKLVVAFKDGRPRQSWSTVRMAARSLGLSESVVSLYRRQGPSRQSELSYVGWEQR